MRRAFGNRSWRPDHVGAADQGGVDVAVNALDDLDLIAFGARRKQRGTLVQVNHVHTSSGHLVADHVDLIALGARR